jgi:serine/threonine protein kinase
MDGGGLVGKRIGHYRVLARLGRGGMGEVYRARDEQLERLVALKVISPELGGGPEHAARMLQEARAVSALNHPGVVTLYDYVELDGVPCLVMELVDGISFELVLRKHGPLAPAEALRLCLLAADALAVAHEHQILHRDVKSANLMRTTSGQIKVLDFGLAKRGPITLASEGATATPSTTEAVSTTGATQPAPASPSPSPSPSPSAPPTPSPAPTREPVSAEDVTLPASPAPDSGPGELRTAAGTRLGTPGYMAPELARGEVADARSDVYGLGCVLYELCTGELPYRSRGWPELLAALEGGPPPRIEQVLPPPVAKVVRRALAPRREARYQTMRELEGALRTAARAIGWRSRVTRAAIAGTAVLAVGGVAVMTLRAQRGPSTGISSPSPTGSLSASASAGASSGSPSQSPAGSGSGHPASAAAFTIDDPPRQLTNERRCIDVPLFDADGSLVATDNMSDPLVRLPPGGGAPTPLDGTASGTHASPGGPGTLLVPTVDRHLLTVATDGTVTPCRRPIPGRVGRGRHLLLPRQ